LQDILPIVLVFLWTNSHNTSTSKIESHCCAVSQSIKKWLYTK